ncbi:erythroblast NAD(P)(+)--arginine ADP-ribosyltransferase-like [Mustelus asterias]
MGWYFHIILCLFTWHLVSSSVLEGQSCGDPNTGKPLGLEENSAAFWFSQTKAQDKMAVAYLEKELASEGYAQNWRLAKELWRSKNISVPRGLWEEHIVAVTLYTDRSNLSTFLSSSIAAHGGIANYNANFTLKSLHYLLTVALQTLRNGSRELHVHRGTRELRFAKRGQAMRFARFASCSLELAVAQQFGDKTLFAVNTSYGVVIRNYSWNEKQEEVLIPPYERFEVVRAQGRGQGRCLFSLRSRGYEGVKVRLEEDDQGGLMVHLQPDAWLWWALLVAVAILSALVVAVLCCVRIFRPSPRRPQSGGTYTAGQVTTEDV